MAEKCDPIKNKIAPTGKNIFRDERIECIKQDGCRYLLRARRASHRLIVIGANPSIADDKTDDPTVSTIRKIATSNGFDGISIVNLYPVISTDPRQLPKKPNQEIVNRNMAIIKTEIDGYSKKEPSSAIIAWCAWGNLVEKYPLLKAQVPTILGLFPKNTQFLCLEITKSGNPAHPLYHKANSKLIPYIF